MNRTARIVVFLIGAAGLTALLAMAYSRIPARSSIRDRYADRVNAGAVPQRMVTNAVAAVNFDYRAFDTMGEEFILFVSVMGVLVLLREEKPKKTPRLLRDAITAGRNLPASDAMRGWVLVMVAPKVLFGLYILAHGALTPGGGFQGGVILATAPLIIYLSEGYATLRKVVSFHLLEMVEAAGAAAFVLVGVIALFADAPFLANVLGHGVPGHITAGGIIPLLNFGTGIEVSAGFVLLLYVFLQDTLTPKEKKS